MSRRKEARRAARREHDAEALNLVSMIDMFTVLVFFLLITSTQILFTDTRAFGLTLPGSATAASDAPTPQRIEIVVREAGIAVGDSTGGTLGTFTHAELPRMQALLVELKRRAPDERKVSLLAESTVPYQTLVNVLDRVRSYSGVTDGRRTNVELFPEVAMGDAPADVPMGEEARSS